MKGNLISQWDGTASRTRDGMKVCFPGYEPAIGNVAMVLTRAWRQSQKKPDHCI